MTELARLKNKIKNDPTLNLVVPDRLSKVDPLVKEAKQDLKGRKSDRYSHYKNIITTSRGIIHISVSSENVPRALRFMDTLIKLVKARGHKVEVDQNHTYFIINDEKFKVRCREILKRVVVPSSGSWTYSEYVPAGMLSFRVDDLYGKEWRDTSVKLEEKLPTIMAGLEIKAAQEKVKRAEIEARHREYQRELDEEKRQEEQRQLEIKEFNMLLSDADNWSKSKIIENYLAEIQSKLDANTIHQEDIKKWLKWANSKKEELNPIADGITKMIDVYSVYNK